jgi:hypothetical protein
VRGKAHGILGYPDTAIADLDHAVTDAREIGQAATLMHRRVGEIMRDRFAATAVAEPELLAHHFTKAGLPETAVEWWGMAGQRSLERSALVEAAEQFTRAIAQIAGSPVGPAVRHKEIKLQVALITPLIHVKGYAAPETKAAMQARRGYRIDANPTTQGVGERDDGPHSNKPTRRNAW